MPFDWDKYKKLAEELKQRPVSDEAAQRSAISRLYYSVFWKARLLLEKEGINVPRESAHGFVWNKYRTQGGTRRTIGDKGRQLQLKREDADYEAEMNHLEDDVIDSFKLADSVLHFLKMIQPSDEEIIN
jgi:uncharacterized protein (UPF0332 family)